MATSKLVPQMGTWYFDKWTCHYVKIVAGAQGDNQITVDDTRLGVTVVLPLSHLDLNRSWTPDWQRAL